MAKYNRKEKEQGALLCEMWKVKENGEWWHLPVEERRRLFGSIDPSIHSGFATLIGAAVNESPDKIGNEFYLAFAFWTVKDLEGVARIRELLETDPTVAFFKKYFDQVTLAGLNDLSPDGPVFIANTERESDSDNGASTQARQTLTGSIASQSEKIDKLADAVSTQGRTLNNLADAIRELIPKLPTK